KDGNLLTQETLDYAATGAYGQIVFTERDASGLVRKYAFRTQPGETLEYYITEREKCERGLDECVDNLMQKGIAPISEGSYRLVEGQDKNGDPKTYWDMVTYRNFETDEQTIDPTEYTYGIKLPDGREAVKVAYRGISSDEMSNREVKGEYYMLARGREILWETSRADHILPEEEAVIRAAEEAAGRRGVAAPLLPMAALPGAYSGSVQEKEAIADGKKKVATGYSDGKFLYAQVDDVRAKDFVRVTDKRFIEGKVRVTRITEKVLDANGEFLFMAVWNWRFNISTREMELKNIETYAYDKDPKKDEFTKSLTEFDARGKGSEAERSRFRDRKQFIFLGTETIRVPAAKAEWVYDHTTGAMAKVPYTVSSIKVDFDDPATLRGYNKVDETREYDNGITVVKKSRRTQFGSTTESTAALTYTDAVSGEKKTIGSEREVVSPLERAPKRKEYAQIAETVRTEVIGQYPDGAGKSVKGYDAGGRLIGTYEYDENGGLVKISRPDESYRSFVYYPGTAQARVMKEYSAGNKELTAYEYNDKGTLLKETSDGTVYTFHEENGRIYTVEDSEGRKWEFSKDKEVHRKGDRLNVCGYLIKRNGEGNIIANIDLEKWTAEVYFGEGMQSGAGSRTFTLPRFPQWRHDVKHVPEVERSSSVQYSITDVAGKLWYLDSKEYDPEQNTEVHDILVYHETVNEMEEVQYIIRQDRIDTAAESDRQAVIDEEKLRPYRNKVSLLTRYWDPAEADQYMSLVEVFPKRDYAIIHKYDRNKLRAAAYALEPVRDFKVLPVESGVVKMKFTQDMVERLITEAKKYEPYAEIENLLAAGERINAALVIYDSERQQRWVVDITTLKPALLAELKGLKTTKDKLERLARENIVVQLFRTYLPRESEFEDEQWQAVLRTIITPGAGKGKEVERVVVERVTAAQELLRRKNHQLPEGWFLTVPLEAAAGRYRAKAVYVGRPVPKLEGVAGQRHVVEFYRLPADTVTIDPVTGRILSEDADIIAKFGVMIAPEPGVTAPPKDFYTEKFIYDVTGGINNVLYLSVPGTLGDSMKEKNPEYARGRIFYQRKWQSRNAGGADPREGPGGLPVSELLVKREPGQSTEDALDGAFKGAVSSTHNIDFQKRPLSEIADVVHIYYYGYLTEDRTTLYQFQVPVKDGKTGRTIFACPVNPDNTIDSTRGIKLEYHPSGQEGDLRLEEDIFHLANFREISALEGLVPDELDPGAGSAKGISLSAAPRLKWVKTPITSFRDLKMTFRRKGDKRLTFSPQDVGTVLVRYFAPDGNYGTPADLEKGDPYKVPYAFEIGTSAAAKTLVMDALRTLNRGRKEPDVMFNPDASDDVLNGIYTVARMNGITGSGDLAVFLENAVKMRNIFEKLTGPIITTPENIGAILHWAMQMTLEKSPETGKPLLSAPADFGEFESNFIELGNAALKSFGETENAEGLKSADYMDFATESGSRIISTITYWAGNRNKKYDFGTFMSCFNAMARNRREIGIYLRAGVDGAGKEGAVVSGDEAGEKIEAYRKAIEEGKSDAAYDRLSDPLKFAEYVDAVSMFANYEAYTSGGLEGSRAAYLMKWARATAGVGREATQRAMDTELEEARAAQIRSAYERFAAGILGLAFVIAAAVYGKKIFRRWKSRRDKSGAGPAAGPAGPSGPSSGGGTGAPGAEAPPAAGLFSAGTGSAMSLVRNIVPVLLVFMLLASRAWAGTGIIDSVAVSWAGLFDLLGRLSVSNFLIAAPASGGWLFFYLGSAYLIARQVMVIAGRAWAYARGPLPKTATKTGVITKEGFKDTDIENDMGEVIGQMKDSMWDVYRAIEPFRVKVDGKKITPGYRLELLAGLSFIAGAGLLSANFISAVNGLTMGFGAGMWITGSVFLALSLLYGYKFLGDMARIMGFPLRKIHRRHALTVMEEELKNLRTYYNTLINAGGYGFTADEWKTILKFPVQMPFGGPDDAIETGTQTVYFMDYLDYFEKWVKFLSDNDSYILYARLSYPASQHRGNVMPSFYVRGRE
ncbi:MAG: hypothetical protein ABIA77_06760, partial [Candidatus Omnitrophota bacterium]